MKTHDNKSVEDRMPESLSIDMDGDGSLKQYTTINGKRVYWPAPYIDFIAVIREAGFTVNNGVHVEYSYSLKYHDYGETGHIVTGSLKHDEKIALSKTVELTFRVTPYEIKADSE